MNSYTGKFSGSDYMYPGSEERDRQRNDQKKEEPYFTIVSYPGEISAPRAA